MVGHGTQFALAVARGPGGQVKPQLVPILQVLQGLEERHPLPLQECADDLIIAGAKPEGEGNDAAAAQKPGHDPATFATFQDAYESVVMTDRILASSRQGRWSKIVYT